MEFGKKVKCGKLVWESLSFRNFMNLYKVLEYLHKNSKIKLNNLNNKNNKIVLSLACHLEN